MLFLQLLQILLLHCIVTHLTYLYDVLALVVNRHEIITIIWSTFCLVLQVPLLCVSAMEKHGNIKQVDIFPTRTATCKPDGILQLLLFLLIAFVAHITSLLKYR